MQMIRNLASQPTAFLVWKIMLNRLPTKINLRARNILVDEEELRCIFCDNVVESINHCFLSCDKVMEIWKACYVWLHVSKIIPNSSEQHFWQHAHFVQTKLEQDMWQVVWVAAVSNIWV